MTREEAIKVLKKDLKIIDDPKVTMTAREWEEHDDHMRDALEMAIQALEQELKWIPVTKALPTKGIKVLVQSNYPNLTYVAEIGSFLSQPEGWRTADGYERIEQTVAWMPLPEPYTNSN